ncbi:MAG TPA: enoyl-CoA hydratase/isomerase family protein [Acidimicrobiales bacterium]|jgi:2-(1,2-epoxy-1,2-dihydrophenyl)acetyl-CoA isomerase
MVLLVERTGSVTHLILNRPDAYNAIDADLRDEMLAALDAAESDGTTCVVVRGAGRGFCAGMDLRAGGGNRGVDLAHAMRESSSRLTERFLRAPVPIVAAVHGACAGLGLTLALSADHCVAADDARFVAGFVSRSLVPDGAVSLLLPRLVGTARARRMLLFGEEISAVQALEWGMIGEVIGPAELVERAQQRAEALSALPRHVVRYTRSLLSRSFDIGWETVLFEEQLAQGVVSTSDDYAEGAAAFFERRTPRFTGH